MTPARASLLSLTAILPLAVAACDTVKKPIRGYDRQPPGTLLLDDPAGGTVMIWPLFALPQTDEMFRLRLDGQDIVYKTTFQDGFVVYDYSDWSLRGWTGGISGSMGAIEPGPHVVELVDSAGQSWGRSAPLAIPAGGDPSQPLTGQFPAVVFANFDGKVGAWNIDPATQDADSATDQITVTNLVDADVVVERCQISSGRSSSCTAVGTVAAGAELLTVETMADVSSKDDHQALVIHLASDGNQSYQRDLIQGGGEIFSFGATCQMERIVVHGQRHEGIIYGPPGGVVFAMSSCYGYRSGPVTAP
jgi:hypothetical protein